MSNDASRHEKIKKDTYKFTSDFYKFLKSHHDHIFFKKIYGNKVGKYDYQTTDLIVDYRRDLLSILIHEYAHHKYPEWCETKVLSFERKMINILSEKQIKNILRAIGKIV